MGLWNFSPLSRPQITEHSNPAELVGDAVHVGVHTSKVRNLGKKWWEIPIWVWINTC